MVVIYFSFFFFLCIFPVSRSSLWNPRQETIFFVTCLLNIETQRWESCQCFFNRRFYFLRVPLNSWVVLKQDLGGETHGINQGWTWGRLKRSCNLLLCRVMSPELWVLSLPVGVDWRQAACWVSANEAVGWFWWMESMAIAAGFLGTVPRWHGFVCGFLSTCWDLHRGRGFAGILFLLLENCSAIIKSVTMSVLTWLSSNWCSWAGDRLVLT